MNRIAARAAALGLPITANALAEARLDPDVAPRDPRLVEPVAGDVKRIFGQMARRGHDPALVAALWDLLDGRPLERALIAVDVLARSLWAPDAPLEGELRAAARSLGAARPPAGEVGIALEAHPARALLERHAPLAELAARPTVELLALAYEQHLGALEELVRRSDELVARPATLESVHAFARLAALARLPTLASVYLDWLVHRVGWRAAADDLCETLFDAGVAQKIPATTIASDALSDYALYRAHMGVGDTDTANALLQQHIAERGGRNTLSPRDPSSLRTDVVRAHLGILYGHLDVPLARLEAACEDDRLWRYAAQVRALVAAARHPDRALELFHAQLAAFGNDLDTSLAAISLVPEDLKRELARILCREAFYLPHEPAPWKLLGALFGVSDPITDEIDARLRARSA